MKNILVIDDDKTVCLLIEKLTRGYGAITTVVRSGEDARNVLQSGKKFDVIFLDLIVPYISGWDVLTVIKNDPATANTPVVIMTGCSLSHEETGRLQAKVSAIVDKSTFDTDRFVIMLEQLL
ncbi:MAG: hypothetical protein A2283_22035 [Lentisphaerae bacterium RIFOXYA12_FULL_48_11]|nr:MAG: hypothetical protein A2283_22035 [Lentisphaerae bacterium RIFOXYA12_FULL_48_11]